MRKLFSIFYFVLLIGLVYYGIRLIDKPKIVRAAGCPDTFVDSCGKNQCGGSGSSSLYYGLVHDVAGDCTEVRHWEYFTDSSCSNQTDENDCPSGCSSNGECNGGACIPAGYGSDYICNNSESAYSGFSYKFCQGVSCGYNCSGNSCQKQPFGSGQGVGQYSSSNCNGACSGGGGPQPTSPPNPGGTGRYDCSSGGLCTQAGFFSTGQYPDYSSCIAVCNPSGGNPGAARYSCNNGACVLNVNGSYSNFLSCFASCGSGGPQPTSPPGGPGGSCSVGQSCSNCGGSPGQCQPDCNGGWCNGGSCSSCGSGPPAPPPRHNICQGQTCRRVNGSGSNQCGSVNQSCSGTNWGSWGGGASCGVSVTETRSCQCNGPCCTGCAADADGGAGSCNATQSRTVCRSEAPDAPTGLQVREVYPDGGLGGTAFIQTRRVQFSWNFGAASGCGQPWGFNCNGNNNSFTVRVTGGGINQTFSFLPSTQYSWTSGAIFQQNNVPYTLTVCAENGFGQTCAPPLNFTKVAYPPGTVSGQVGEFDPDVANSCFLNGGNGNLQFAIRNADGTINSTCTTTTDGTAPLVRSLSYTCDFTLDNVNADPLPGQVVTVNWSNPGANPQYLGLHCEDTGATCTALGTGCSASMNFDRNGALTTTATKQAFLTLNPNIGFYKLKNVSYNDHNDIVSYFPINVQPFDGDDTDVSTIGTPANPNHFIIGANAAQLNAVGMSLTGSSNVQFYGMADVSRTGIKNSDGSAYGLSLTSFTAGTFRDYVRARKVYTAIAGDLGEAKDGVNIKDANVDITNLPGGFTKGVIVVNGTATINAPIFNPGRVPVAIIARKLIVADGVQEINGLFIADVIQLSTDGTNASTTPLKINGNMTSLTAAVDVAQRSNPNNFQPAIFVNFVPDFYVNLLPYLSTSTYERK